MFVVISFSCSTWLAFLILADLVSLMRLVYSPELFALEANLFLTPFLKKYLNFWGFSICSSFGFFKGRVVKIVNKVMLLSNFLFGPLLRGGTIYSNGFFYGQSIWTGRYTQRRELWVVSFKSPSSVEYEIKKILISFSRASYRGLNFCEY